LRDSAIEDGHSQVGSPVAGARVEANISRHAHILQNVREEATVLRSAYTYQASKSITNTRVVSAPVTHDETKLNALAKPNMMIVWFVPLES